jgi:hypothetical protein
VSGKRREGKCLHVNTDGSVCGLSHGMRTEREYCYTCQRLVPYDKDTTSDARHYTQIGLKRNTTVGVTGCDQLRTVKKSSRNRTL